MLCLLRLVYTGAKGQLPTDNVEHAEAERSHMNYLSKPVYAIALLL